MRDFIFSSSAFKIYSAFLVNLAAASFLTTVFSGTIFDLTIRFFAATMYLYLAIKFEAYEF